ncbi:MAG: DsrE/DsrF/DrsH-like family protein [Actinomycetota bacterium]|nr:DsrE/DsrF/DrsH-like family protein [Actinomycetota bacterium]
MEHVEAADELERLKERKTKNKVTIIVFSGELDKVLAAFNIATGARSMGMDATLFFTFWGLNVLKKNDAGNTAKGWMKKMLGWMNKGGTDRLPLSKFHMHGMGTWMMKKLMREHKMPSVDEMMVLGKELGIKFVACTITMGIMGIEKEALRPEIDSFAGVVTYLAEAQESSVNLFI